MNHTLQLKLFILALLIIGTILISTPVHAPRISPQIPLPKGNEASPSVGPADFSISANPNSTTLTSGSSTTITLTLTSLNGLSGTVVLAALFLPLDGSFNPPSVALSSSGTNTTILTVVAPIGLSPGDYSVFITAASGCTLSHTLFVAVDISGADFSITPSQGNVTLSPGSSTQLEIVFGSLGGFAGSVTVSTTVVQPSAPIVATPNSTTIGITKGGVSSFPLTMSALDGANPGNYTLNIVASSGTLINATQIIVNVPGPDFSLSANPSAIIVASTGGSNSSTIMATPLAGFTGFVNLTATPAANSNLTATFSAAKISPPGTSTLTVTSTSATVPGDYYIDVTGTKVGGTLSRDAFVLVTVKGPDFQIFAVPSFLSVVSGGQTCTSIIQLTGVDGFSGSVSLTPNSMGSGLTVKLPVKTVSVPGSSTLSVSAGTATPGSYDIEVTGQSGSLSQLTVVTVLVTGPDFGLSASPRSVTVTAGGASASVVIKVTAENKFSGTVNLFNSTSDPGIQTTLNPLSIVTSGTAALRISAAPSVVPDTYSVEVQGSFFTTSAFLEHTVIISVTVLGPDFNLTASPTIINVNPGAQGSASIKVTPLLGFASSVDLTAFPSTNLSATIQPSTIPSGSGTAALAVNSTLPGFYTVDVEGSTSTGIVHDIIIDVNVNSQDFSTSASPSTVTLLVNNQGNSTIAILPIGGFTGTVSLATTTNSTNLQCKLSQATVTGGSGASTLSCIGKPPGNYQVTITGTNGAISHSTKVIYHFQDFNLSATPSQISLSTPGIAGTSTISVTPINGFTGNVAFSLGAVPTGCSTNFAGTTLSVSCTPLPSSGFSLLVNGTAGMIPNELSRMTTVTVTVPGPDFSISAAAVTPSTILATKAGQSSISINPSGGFTGTVTFTVSTSMPTGLTCNTPNSVTTSGTTTLSCSATVGGDYTVTVTGKSGTVSHTTSPILFHVVDFSLSAPDVTTLATVPGTSAITITPINGFSGAVTLTAGTAPSGCTFSFSIGNVLSVTCATGVPPFSVLVTGKTGTAPNSLSRTASINITIQDFSLSAPAITILATLSGTSTITVTPINGFGGTVTFSAGAVPIGCSAAFAGNVLSVACASGIPPFNVTVNGTTETSPNNLSRTYNVATTIQDFSLSAPGITTLATVIGSSTVSVMPINGFASPVSFTAGTIPNGCTTSFSGNILTVACSTGVAPFSLQVTGTTGTNPNALSRTTSVNVTIEDFSLSSSPGNIPLTTAGATGTSIISVTNINGFAGTVSLSVTSTQPSGCTATVMVNMLSVKCSPLPSTGFSVTVTGITGTAPNSLSRTINVPVVLSGFTMTAGPTSITTLATVLGNSTVTITPVGSFSGSVVLVASGAPAGCTATITSPLTVPPASAATLSVSCPNAIATFTITVTGTSGSVVSSVNIPVTVQDFSLSATPITALATVAGSSTLAVTPSNGFTGTVTYTTGTAPSGCTVTVSGSLISVSCSTGVIPFVLQVTGTAGKAPNTLSRTTNISVTIQDFSLSAPAITTLATVPGTSSVAVNSINGFSGRVSLAAGIVPTGCTATFNLQMLSVSCSTGVTPFSLVVTGMTGSAPNILSRLTSVSVSVQDFSVSASPASLALTSAGVTNSSTLSVTPINGFNLAVSISAGSLPSGCGASIVGYRLSVSCNPLPNAGFTISVTTSAGTSPNILSRPLNIQVIVGAQLTLISSPASITTTAAVAGNSTINLEASGTLSGKVTLATGPVPSGCTATVTSSVTITPGATASFFVTCSAGVAPFSVLITGISGSVAGSVTVLVTVQDYAITVENSGPIDQGDSAIVTVNLTSVNGFSGPTVLIVASQPGLSCGAVSPPTLSLPIQTGSAVTCTSDTAGNYNVTVTAASGRTSHMATTTITVNESTSQAPNRPEIAGLDPALFYAIVGFVVAGGLGGLIVVARRTRKAR